MSPPLGGFQLNKETEESEDGERARDRAGSEAGGFLLWRRPAFSTEKAYLMHMRTKHGFRCDARRYIGHDAVCPVCKMSFPSRLKAIAHLSEKRMRGRRKVRCYDSVLNASLVPLPDNLVQELDEADRLSRTKARKCGHSHPTHLVHAKRTLVRGVPDSAVTSNIEPKRRRLTFKQPV